MADRETTCCFTGHRAEKLPWRYNETDGACLALKERIFDSVEAAWFAGYRHFICGMATGTDMYFCEAVLRLRDEREGVTLEAAIPFEGQSDKWDAFTRKRYFRLVTECDRQTVLQSRYTRECMIERNRYMVDASSLLIAAYGGSGGGTMHTMLYAMRQGVRIVELEIEGCQD